MKKLLLLTILILGISTSMNSCKKKQCWQCTMNTRITQYEETKSSSEKSSICDKTKEEIDAYARNASRTTTSGEGRDQAQIEVSMTCSGQ